jgi:ubiquinone/menaquinone biosynthesis C-methylase UbiE
MDLIEETRNRLGRARYAAAQGARSAWYAAQYASARRRASGFNRPGEPPFRPSRGRPDIAEMRRAWLKLFREDRANIEAGLYPAPRDVRLRDIPRALRSARQFLADVAEVDRRRVARDGTELRRSPPADLEPYPPYYRQNFHYQSDGWLSDESAALYDHQVEALFTGAGDAMRRAALAEIGRELKQRDPRSARLVDIGCGTGRFLRQTLEAYPRLQATGLDLSPNYTARARRLLRPWPQAELVEGAGEAMPLEDDSQEIAVSIFLFHELPLRVREAVIREAARILVPGGLFIVADSLQFGDNPGLDGILEYFPEGFHEPYYRAYLDWDFEPAMARAGFSPEEARLAFLTKVRTWRKSGGP